MLYISNYIKIARPDHWVKQVFVLPGILLATVFTKTEFTSIILPSAIGILAINLVTSANYTINEWIDAEFDKYHPKKKLRPSVTKKVEKVFVYMQYIALALLGLIIATRISVPFFIACLFLLLMGIIYNVEPFRSKDKPYLDVLSESINNPIRLLLGWLIVVSDPLPPSTLLLSYWMGGAFLMGVKRYSEYVFINNTELAGLYRKSFQHYTSTKILISSFFYALTSVFFLGVFMIKYKVELLLTFPLFSLLFTWYLNMAFQTDSPTQHPEGLYMQKRFILYLIFLCTLVIVLMFVHIPVLSILTQNILYAPTKN